MYAYCGKLLQCLGGLMVAYCAYCLAIKLWYFITTYYFKRTLDASKYGKWTVVTGASDGLGRQFALQFAERGQNVVLISRSLQKLETVAKEIGSPRRSPAKRYQFYAESKYGVRTKCVEADFRHGAEIYERIAEIVTGLDVGVLVNNVGMVHALCKFAEMPDIERVIDEVIPTNILSQLKMSNMVIPGMVQRKRGLIINVSSGGRVAPSPNMALYGSTKAFMDYFSCSTALEYKEDGIDIVSLMPYFVSTKLNNHLPLSFWIREPEDYISNVMSAVASGCKRTHGCWQHDLQGWIGRHLPDGIYQSMLQYNLATIKKNT